jgi:Ca2+-transporting ATPase
MWLTTSEASTLGTEEVVARLRADLRIGLRWREAELRRQLAGYNELTVREEEPTWKKYVEQVSVGYVLVNSVCIVQDDFLRRAVINDYKLCNNCQ